ncbi:MAG: di-heme oxidoredictase family protein, partial [bacterium]
MTSAPGLGLVVLLFTNLSCLEARTLVGKETAAYSPSAVIADGAGTGVYVAEYLARQVVHIALSDGHIDSVAEVDERPSGLALDVKAGRLYVTLDSPVGMVVALDAKSGKRQFSVAVGHSPVSPALTADGALLAVCNRFNDNVSLVDVKARKELGRVPVQREPVAAVFSADGKWLVIASHLPVKAAGGDYPQATVSLVNPASRSVVTNIVLPNGSTALRGVCVSPDSRFAYVTHSLGRYQLPTTQLERGWMNTSAISIIDLSGTNVPATVLLDDVDLGAANPWGVTCSSDGGRLLVAHAGTHELSVIDRPALHERLVRVAKGERAGVSTSLAEVPNDLSFLVGIRQRVQLPGNGPRSLCVAGDKAVVGMHFSDELAVVPMSDQTMQATVLALGPKSAMSTVRKGEMFFNDAQLCFQKWQSCASCHPDGRADGLNWDLLNDGIGNPKNTKNMLLCFQTPPSMSLGIRDSAGVAVRAGLKFIQFAERPEEDALAIDAYLTAMQPVPSPHLVKGKLSEAADRGRKIFKRAGCADCHPGPLYTDLKSYDVELGGGEDKGKSFDTPPLVEVWRTAPYLHDGRADTIDESIRLHEGEGRASRDAYLTFGERDRAKVVAFLASLGGASQRSEGLLPPDAPL